MFATIRVLLAFGIRNLSRNARRTFLSLVIMAGGFVAVVTFRGFAEYIVDATRWGAVNSQYGHIQVASRKLWNQDAAASFLDRQLTRVDDLKKLIQAHPGVTSVAARQNLYGLASTGEKSIAAQLIGFEPKIEKEILTEETVVAGELKALENATLEQPKVALGEGLAAALSAQVGQNLTLIAQTGDGAINAIDVQVGQIVRTVIQEIDDTTIYLALPVMQKLTDSDAAERLIVKLKDHDLVEPTLTLIRRDLNETEQAKGWLELARLFVQTSEFFNTQNLVVSAIIFSLIFLATVSTVSMAVSERIGEIGTARALGWKNGEIISLFAVEGLVQGLIGSLAGILVAAGVMFVVNRVDIPLVLPGATEAIPIRVHVLVSAYFAAAVSTVLASVGASVLAARRATKMTVVECLKYNV